MREVERQVLLRIIDQRWRTSIRDGLSAGRNPSPRHSQKDPVAEWQREGFDMFSSMLESVYSDFVKHAMHAEVVIADGQRSGDGLTYSSSETNPNSALAAPPKSVAPNQTSKQTQVVKTEEQKSAATIHVIVGQVRNSNTAADVEYRDL